MILWHFIVYEFFSTVPVKNFDLCIISTRTKIYSTGSLLIACEVIKFSNNQSMFCMSK